MNNKFQELDFYEEAESLDDVQFVSLEQVEDEDDGEDDFFLMPPEGTAINVISLSAQLNVFELSPALSHTINSLKSAPEIINLLGSVDLKSLASTSPKNKKMLSMVNDLATKIELKTQEEKKKRDKGYGASNTPGSSSLSPEEMKKKLALKQSEEHRKRLMSSPKNPSPHGR